MSEDRPGVLAQLEASEAQFHAIAQAMPQMGFRTSAGGEVDFFNPSWYAFTGMPSGSGNLDGWRAALHPDDVARVVGIWQNARLTGEPCEDEYRLRHHSSDYRWVLTRAQPVKTVDGTVVRWLGTSTDIHAIKMAEAQRQLMLEEMTHRVMNTMTMVQAVVSQSLRGTESVEDARATIEGRIDAMARAHDQLVRAKWADARIASVVETSLTAHRPGMATSALTDPTCHWDRAKPSRSPCRSTNWLRTPPSMVPCRTRPEGSKSPGASIRRTACSRWTGSSVGGR